MMVGMMKELLAAALAKAGNRNRLAKALGESHQLVLHWAKCEKGPPNWRRPQLQAYLEGGAKVERSQDAA